MDPADLFPYLLYLHVFGAILAFGPTYAYSIIGALARGEPPHANFGLRAVAAIGSKLVYPLAILQGVTGLGLIITGEIDLTASPWLLTAIALYLFALTYALTIQRNALQRMIELTSTPPPPGTPPGPPPPELVATGAKIGRGGMLLGVLVAVIVFLMVVKPSF